MPPLPDFHTKSHAGICQALSWTAYTRAGGGYKGRDFHSGLFKTGVMAYFRKMYEKESSYRMIYESMAMMFLSLNFDLYFLRPFGSGLTDESR